jgi:hypothetical protein
MVWFGLNDARTFVLYLLSAIGFQFYIPELMVILV